MVDSNRPEFAPGIDGLQRLIAATSFQERQSEEKVLERLLISLGYSKPKLIRPQLKVKFTNELKNFIRRKEEEITNKLKYKEVPVSMDRTTARYIIRTALCCFCCDEIRKKLKKNDVDKFLGYCGRTMRLQQNIWEADILNPFSESKERKIYLELCSDLEQFAI